MSTAKYEQCQSREVVITQPTTTVKVTSPNNPLMPRGEPRDWSSTTFSCFDDMSICLKGFFCAPCYQCCLASEMGESCCVPCCVPGSLVAMRTQVRGRHNLHGSIMGDCVCSMFCGTCTQCQLGREVKMIKSGKAAQ